MPLAQPELDLLWDFSDAPASEKRLRAAAESAVDPGVRAELQTQVARALGLQDRFAEADALLDAITSDAPAVRTRVALERGRVRNSRGEPDAAVPFLRSAAEVAAAADLVFLQVDALHMLAIAEPAHAGRWTARAQEVLADVTDERTLRWNVALHNNAGWTSFDAGRIDEAIAAFERAREAAVRWGTPQQVQWADEALEEARAARG